MPTKERRARSIYRHVEVRVWSDEKFAELSRPKPSAQFLWLYLLTAPQSKAYPGLFELSVADLADRFGWKVTETTRALNEILSRGMAEHDAQRRLIYLPKAIRSNPPLSVNHAKAWGHSLLEFPDCPIRTAAKTAALEFLASDRFGPTFVAAFGEGLGLARQVVGQDLPLVVGQGVGHPKRHPESREQRAESREQRSPLSPPTGGAGPSASESEISTATPTAHPNPDLAERTKQRLADLRRGKPRF